MSVKKGTFWGIGIWLFYGGFVLFILACISYVAFRRYDLVEPDYYEKGLAYQKQLSKIRPNPEKLPNIIYDKSTEILTIAFAESSTAAIDSGTILFFKPADAQKDFQINLVLDKNKKQDVRDKRLGKGYWRLKLNWQTGDREYYCEEALFVE